MPPPHPIEPDDHRRARHLFVLKGLTDRCVTLAHKAADQAEEQLGRPAPGPAPAPAPDKPNTPAPDHHRTFERYVRLIHALIALEHRIATNAAQPRRTDRPTTSAAAHADPRRPKLREFLHKATTSAPDRAKLRRDATILLDELLDADAALTRPAGAILAEISDRYGLPFDLTKLPDEFLLPPKPDHIPR